MFILMILAYILLGILGLLFLLVLTGLLLPITCGCQVACQDNHLSGRWHVVILFRRFGIRGEFGKRPRWVLWGRERQPSDASQDTRATDAQSQGEVESVRDDGDASAETSGKESPKRKSRRPPVRARTVWRCRGVLFRLLRRSGRALHLRIEGKWLLGLEDPSLVGWLCGAYWAVLGRYADRFQVNWSYVEEVCEGEARATARVRLIEFLWVVIRSVFELPLIQLWRDWKSHSRKGD